MHTCSRVVCREIFKWAPCIFVPFCSICSADRHSVVMN